MKVEESVSIRNRGISLTDNISSSISEGLILNFVNALPKSRKKSPIHNVSTVLGDSGAIRTLDPRLEGRISFTKTLNHNNQALIFFTTKLQWTWKKLSAIFNLA